MTFQKAEKKGIRLRMALLGPTGSGKTYWMLKILQELSRRNGNHVPAVIDSERGSAKKYADIFPFDVSELLTYEPQKYVQLMREAAEAGYPFLGIDSLSHAWAGTGGLLEQKDRAVEKSTSKNSYTAWGKLTPIQNQMVDTMLDYPGHLVVTMRTKMEYIQLKDDQTNKTRIEKIGLQPIQRDGLEYDFDIIGDINLDHDLLISKSRCPLVDGKLYRTGDLNLLLDPLCAWLGSVDQVPAPDPLAPQAEPHQLTPAPDRGSEPPKTEKERLIEHIERGEKKLLADKLVNANYLTSLKKDRGVITLADASVTDLRSYLDALVGIAKQKGAK